MGMLAWVMTAWPSGTSRSSCRTTSGAGSSGRSSAARRRRARRPHHQRLHHPGQRRDLRGHDARRRSQGRSWGSPWSTGSACARKRRARASTGRLPVLEQRGGSVGRPPYRCGRLAAPPRDPAVPDGRRPRVPNNVPTGPRSESRRQSPARRSWPARTRATSPCRTGVNTGTSAKKLIVGPISAITIAVVVNTDRIAQKASKA